MQGHLLGHVFKKLSKQSPCYTVDVSWQQPSIDIPKLSRVRE